MEYTKFSLGLRFAMTEDAALSPDACWDIVFSETSPSHTQGLQLFGMWDDTACAESEEAYICMFSNVPLGAGKSLYAELKQKPRLLSYLTIYRPFVQNNLVERCGNVEYLGAVDENGFVSGGAAAYGAMRFFGSAPVRPKKSAKRTTLLLAPDAWEGVFTSADAARHMQRAAAFCLPDVIVETQLVADGGRGTLDALVCSVNGRYLLAELDGASGKTPLRYGILPDESVVFETEGLDEAQILQAMTLPQNRGYTRCQLAAGGGGIPAEPPAHLKVTVLSRRVGERAGHDNPVRFRSGIEAVLETGGLDARLAHADWLIVLTRLLDEHGLLLGPTADTLLYHGRRAHKRAAALAFSPDGRFYAKIGDAEPELLDGATFDEAARAFFGRIGISG